MGGISMRKKSPMLIILIVLLFASSTAFIIQVILGISDLLKKSRISEKIIISEHLPPIKPDKEISEGVIGKMSEKGIPVIELISIEKLAKKYGLPIAPQPLPEVGEGKIFFQPRYNLIPTALAIIVLIIFIYSFIRLDLKHYWFMAKGQLKIKENYYEEM
jgi:hypothetical protein